MEQVESVRQDDLVHAHGERQVVRRVLEERVSADVDFVEVNPRQKGGQSERLLIRDEVDLVAALREGDAKLGRYGARATIGGIAGDPDVHWTALSARVQRRIHARASATEWGSSGLIRVTRSGGS